MAELWIIPPWVYSRQYTHVFMCSHYKAKCTRRNNMLFVWLQNLQQPLAALPADGSSVYCLHFSTCEERKKPSSRGQILTGEAVPAKRTSLKNSQNNKIWIQMKESGSIWKSRGQDLGRSSMVTYSSMVMQHFKANFRHLILIKTFSSPLQHLIKSSLTKMSVFFSSMFEMKLGSSMKHTVLEDTFLDKKGSFPGKTWWQSQIKKQSALHLAIQHSVLLEWIQT